MAAAAALGGKGTPANRGAAGPIGPADDITVGADPDADATNERN